MSLLRVSTAGSVDDGKSTLIGRMLYDAKGLLEDQLEAARRATRNQTAGEIDLSLLTDGLRAEREQGITIDVAYRYFATAKRKFILADTPGHEQYTRNMATGASTADLAIVLVDARKGVLPQSRRHTAIASLLGIPKLVVTVNKMDLIDWDRAKYDAIVAEFRAVCARLNAPEPLFIPVSALLGDNVTQPSARTPWHTGPTLLSHLEEVVVPTREDAAFRLPVQLVLRPDHAFRGFSGRITSGRIAVDDEVVALPSGRKSKVRRIHTHDGDLQSAAAPESVSLLLHDEIDISRGDLLARVGEAPKTVHLLEANVVWMDEHPLVTGRPYLLRQSTRTSRAFVTAILARRDIVTLAESPAETLRLNDIARVRIESALPIYLDAYTDHRETGSFLLIDPETNATSGAGMIAADQPAQLRSSVAAREITPAMRATRNGHPGMVLWLSGRGGAGKSTIARATESLLFQRGVQVFTLDDDALREGLASDLGATGQDHEELVRRAAEVARTLADAGAVTFVPIALPTAEERARVRRTMGHTPYLEIHVEASADECAERDPRGLYARVRAGELQGVPGVDGAFEPPSLADFTLDTTVYGVDSCAEALLVELARRGVLWKSLSFVAGDGI